MKPLRHSPKGNRSLLAVCALIIALLAGGIAAVSYADSSAGSCSTGQTVLAPTIAINVGGPQVIAGGITWQADKYGEGGHLWTNPANVDVAGTDLDQVYVSERAGDIIRYRIPVTNGKYLVRLHFAEIYWGAPGGAATSVAPGKRIENFNIESGFSEIRQFNPAVDTGGPLRALVYGIETVVFDGELKIKGEGITDKAALQGIEVLEEKLCGTGGTPVTSTVVSSSATTGASATTTVKPTMASPSLVSVQPAPSSAPSNSARPTATASSSAPVVVPSTSGPTGTVIPLGTGLDTGFSGAAALVGNHQVTGIAPAGVTRWRSEAAWREAGATSHLKFAKGDVVDWDFTLRTTNAASQAQQSVVWQILGPTLKNTWPGPAFSVSVAQQKFTIGGGAAVPDGSGGLRKDLITYFKPDHPAVDGQDYRFHIRVLFGGPDVGTVTVDINGVPFVTNQKMKAGTWFHAGEYSHAWMYSKSGFYGGSSGVPLSKEARATTTGMRITLKRGSTTKYYAY